MKKYQVSSHFVENQMCYLKYTHISNLHWFVFVNIRKPFFHKRFVPSSTVYRSTFTRKVKQIYYIQKLHRQGQSLLVQQLLFLDRLCISPGQHLRRVQKSISPVRMWFLEVKSFALFVIYSIVGSFMSQLNSLSFDVHLYGRQFSFIIPRYLT